MSTFWSGFIIVFTVANILGCWWLIRWSGKSPAAQGASTDTTGHVWDDDLTEYNKPMPRWWLILFYLTIWFGLLYLVLYPGFGSFDGVLGWSQYKAYEEEVAEARERYAPLYERYAAMAIPELAKDGDAMQTGQRIFANNCAVCHGSDARGARGYPNLADDAWLYGGEPSQIKASIMNGRQGVMPALGAALDEETIEQVANYVYALNGRQPPNPEAAEAGEQTYMVQCVACHGPEGKGNTAMGAPDLTDDAWLYDGSLESIREAVVNGRQGEMPAHEELLGPERVHVVAAYVYGLGERGESGDESGQ